MAGISSLYTAVSGLNAARTALTVIGHNMANVDKPGYTRQRILQHDSLYKNVGFNQGTPMQVGLGTDFSGIRQIRNKFLDMAYREETGKLAFYNIKATAGSELENVLGELQSDFQTQNVLTDVWEALNELSVYQPGLDTRGNFVSTCITFLDKANNIYDRLWNYQNNLNDQIKQAVRDINTLANKVNNLNQMINDVEKTGDYANDWRDDMNLALDQLSELCDVTIRYDANGDIRLLIEGNELLANGSVNPIGLKYCASDSPMVEPVFTNSRDVIAYNAPPSSYTPLYSLTDAVDSFRGNDKGALKGLMVARGYDQANYTSPLWPDPDMKDTNGNNMFDTSDLDNDAYYQQQYLKNVFDTQYSVIAKAMHDVDVLVNAVVTMINEAMNPNPPAYGLNSDQPSNFQIFVRKNDTGDYATDTDPANPLNNPSNPAGLYTIGNLMINPNLNTAAGYTMIPLSKSGDIEDQSIILDILAQWDDHKIEWKDSNGSVSNLSVEDYYRQFIMDVASTTSESIGFAKDQNTLVQATDNKRQAMSGVSLDEEMEFMLKYQHAYNAAARIVNVIDEMIDNILNLKR